MTTTVTVVEVVDGDTIDVRLDNGTKETVRIIGIDTPETSDNVEAERRAEWEGIEDLTYLGRWGDRASEFAKAELKDTTVELHQDPNEPNRGSYGRLLRYVRYDPSGGSDTSTVYNQRAISKGYARVYDSGFTKHDKYLASELSARQARRHVWKRSDPSKVPETRDSSVDLVFVPQTASIHTESGTVNTDRVPVFASASATQKLQNGTTYDGDIPLVAVDSDARLAVIGGPLVAEQYEEAEGFPTDTSRYGNFPFLTNLISSLTDRSGRIIVDGGHGQFDADYALACEDMAYYLRFLEGQDIILQQRNSLTIEEVANASALVVSVPATPFTDEEISVLQSFVNDGGAVVLLGHGTKEMPSKARANLNNIIEQLGSDLRLNGDRIVDNESNLNDDACLPATANFNDSFDLFGPVTPEKSAESPLKITNIEAASSKTDEEYDEAVSFKNTSNRQLDISGWTVTDDSGKRFEFPDGTILPAGTIVQIRTRGRQNKVEFYWNRSQNVWNNDGDSVYVHDETGDLVTKRSY
ncbi:ABC transporter [halophilic archaeon]|nr:ABC transporter [halophilic archaeon]